MSGSGQEQAPAAGEPSFDPRTWARGASPAGDPQATPEPAAEALPASEPVSSPQPRASGASTRRGLLVGAGVLGVGAVAGGGWLAVRRGGGGGVAGGSGETGRGGPNAGSVASVQRQVMTLDGGGSIQAALLSEGLPQAAASDAAGAALGGLGDATGELRLELATLKPAANAPKTQAARLVSLRVKRPDGSGVSVAPRGTGFAALPLKADTHASTQVVQGQVDAESFYTSAVSAGLADALIPDFFQAFVYDFDFQREIEPGAIFEAAIGETLNDQGQALGARKLLYAAMTTSKKSVALYRFKPKAAAADDPGWYDGSGRSIRRGLMRTPIEGARVSSSFGWRVHPILGFEKLHTGTDFAAPIGTPIYAAGDGVVEWASMKGPNGNLTILKHDNGWETYYLHQNAYAPGVTVGARVRQGQTIGWVGITGRSTGPHLHYELHIDGKPVDAMAQPLDAGVALTGAQIAAFVQQRDAIDKLRAASV